MSTATAEPPKETKPKFTTKEQRAKYEELLGTRFIRLGQDGKPDEKFKDFTYVIEHLFHALVYPGAIDINTQSNDKFSVQKYFVNQLREVTVPNTELKRKVPVAVQRHSPDGQLLDDDAAFFIDCEEFLQKFKQIS